MIEAFADWLAELYSGLGYVEITFLMALESSLFPVPSEAVMIPAGYLAARGDLDPALAVFCGAFGSVLGASFNYLLGQYVGRALLLKYGKYLLIDNDKYHEAEAMFLKNAYLATFIGRLLPVVRHLISLPAGVFGMKWLPFIVITFVGAALWCAVLVAVGYYFGEPALAIVREYMHEVAIAVLVGLVAFAAWFVFHKTRKAPPPVQP